MKAAITLLPRAEEELRDLPARPRQRVIKALKLLADFPYMAQNANMAAAPNVRRIVSGMYLTYYRYDARSNVVYVLTIRHGRREPIEAEELKG